MAILSAWLLAEPRPRFGRWLLAPGGLGIAAILSFVAVYATYQPLPEGAHIVDRQAVWTVPLLEWAAFLGLLIWFGCVSLNLLWRRPEQDGPPPAGR